ncbi:MAG TPA: hypothetical protein VMT32_22095, partial [Bryobacteraceae bacterium]|nr:hypothetical protein [Bryobacteraceae bacterium]
MHGLYRRHEKSCRFAKKGIRHTTCNCPIWLDGSDEHGARNRYSLKTRSWSLAQARIIELERNPAAARIEPTRAPKLEAAIASYLDDCRARKLEDSTITSYTNGLAHLREFFKDRAVDQITLADLTNYRAARAITASTATK